MRKLYLICLMLIFPLIFIGCGKSSNCSWSDWTPNDELTHYRVCTDDDTHTEIKNHNFDNGTTIKQASDIQNGTILYTCVDCGYQNKTNVPPTGNHNFVEEIAEDTYLLRKVSGATSVYYKKCSDCPAFGNDNHIFEKTRLPSQYLELDYIEGDGTRSINTGIEHDIDLSFEIDFSHLTSYVGSYLFGTNEPLYGLARRNTTQLSWFNELNSVFCYNSLNTTDRYHVTCSKNTFVINGDPKPAQPDSVNYTGTTPITIFGGKGTYSAFRLYSFKISKGDEVLRDFVPVLDTLTNMCGLYDVISNKIFFSEYFELGDVSTENVLPAEYTQLDYIESTGTQYIDTGISYSNDVEYKMQCELQYTTTKLKNQIFGFTGNQGSGVGAALNKFWSTQYFVDTTTYYTQEYVKCGGSYTYNLNGQTYIGSHANTSIHQTQNFLLFAAWDSAGSFRPNYHAACKLYKCKLYINNVLVRDYIPCIRLSDNRVGLYDMVTNVFYSDTNTTAFTAGNFAGHDFDNGRVVQAASHVQSGDTVYTCRVCGTEHHVYEDKYSHEVNFVYDQGISNIKVYKDYNPTNFEYSNIAYTRNKNTFNYSKSDPIVIIELILSDGFEFDNYVSSNPAIVITQIEGNKYIFTNITDDIDVQIITKPIVSE